MDSREEDFVNNVIENCQKDPGLAASLRRADNPATEYQSWGFLVEHGVDIERAEEYLPFVIVAAAIARTKAKKNGSVPLGRALAQCYSGHRNSDAKSDPAKARLLRLLACESLNELCRLLRPVMTLIESRGVALDYVHLLKQLRRFSRYTQQVKAQWAQEFYRRGEA